MAPASAAATAASAQQQQQQQQQQPAQAATGFVSNPSVPKQYNPPTSAASIANNSNNSSPAPAGSAPPKGATDYATSKKYTDSMSKKSGTPLPASPQPIQPAQDYASFYRQWTENQPPPPSMGVYPMAGYYPMPPQPPMYGYGHFQNPYPSYPPPPQQWKPAGGPQPPGGPVRPAVVPTPSNGGGATAVTSNGASGSSSSSNPNAPAKSGIGFVRARGLGFKPANIAASGSPASSSPNSPMAAQTPALPEPTQSAPKSTANATTTPAEPAQPQATGPVSGFFSADKDGSVPTTTTAPIIESSNGAFVHNSNPTSNAPSPSGIPASHKGKVYNYKPKASLPEGLLKRPVGRPPKSSVAGAGRIGRPPKQLSAGSMPHKPLGRPPKHRDGIPPGPHSSLKPVHGIGPHQKLAKSGGRDVDPSLPVVLRQAPHPWKWSPSLRPGELGWADFAIPSDKSGSRRTLWPVQIVEVVVARRGVGGEEGRKVRALEGLGTEGVRVYWGEDGVDWMALVAAGTKRLEAVKEGGDGERMDVDNVEKVGEDGEQVDEGGVADMETDEKDKEEEREEEKEDEEADAKKDGEEVERKKDTEMQDAEPLDEPQETATAVDTSHVSDKALEEDVSNLPLRTSESVDQLTQTPNSGTEGLTDSTVPLKRKRGRPPKVPRPAGAVSAAYEKKSIETPIVVLPNRTRSAGQSNNFLSEMKRPVGRPPKSSTKILFNLHQNLLDPLLPPHHPNGALETHYLVRPLPVDSLTLKGDLGECYYRAGNEVVPLWAINPDFKEDVKFNVAALQAIDTGSSWGAPVTGDADGQGLVERKGVWGAVLRRMGVEPRWDEIGVLHTGEMLESKLLETLDSVNMTELRFGFERTWGLKELLNGEVDKLLFSLNIAHWKGNDPVQAPILDGAERLVQRFRLGGERIQVGDLVRLAPMSAKRQIGGAGGGSQPRDGFNSIRSKIALVVPLGTSGKTLGEKQVRIQTDPQTGVARAMEVWLPPAISPLDKYQSNSRRPSKTPPAVYGAAPQIHIQPSASIDDTADSEEAAAPIASGNASIVTTATASPMTEPATLPNTFKPDYDHPYALSLPGTDGVEYLEISYIIVKKPPIPSVLPWRVPIPGNPIPPFSINPQSLKPAIKLIGRVYHRIPSDRASRPSLWYPTGEVRTISNALNGSVTSRVHPQFLNASVVGGWTNTSKEFVAIAGVGENWKGATMEDNGWSGDRGDGVVRTPARGGSGWMLESWKGQGGGNGEAGRDEAEEAKGELADVLGDAAAFA
ncbi:hypothetical protein HDV05_005398, partial [Chytridiales sp. JEL 0842]